MDNKPSRSRVEINNERKRRHHPWRWVLAIVVILIVGVGAYAGNIYFKTKNAIDKTYDPQNAVTQDKFDGKKSFSVLLLGTDTGAFGRKEKRGNSDTIIIATVNPNKKKVSLMSVPRDTMSQMIGTESFDVQKINAAYNIGGPKMAMRSVSRLLNVPLKYYVVMNMAGMQKLVDGVGGVDVTPPLSFSYDGYTFKKGKKMHLSGAAALAYSRMRYDDPEGDYGRQKRQREVIISILKNAISMNTIQNLDSVLDSASNSIKTNLTFNSILAIGTNYRNCTQNISSDYLHGTGAMIGGASYQVMTDKELQRCSDKVRKSLGLETEDLDNNETYQNSKNTQFVWDSQDQYQQYFIYKPNSDELWEGD